MDELIKSIKNSLICELDNDRNNIFIFLETNNKLYSFSHELDICQQLDMISPIKSIIDSRDFHKYDPLKMKQNTIYYVSEDMEEYNSLEFLLHLIQQIDSNEVDRATLKSIDKDKIKNIIIKKNNFIFIYKYTSAKLFKQKFIAIFGKESTIVEKKNDSMLVLTKQMPDIIFDVTNNILFMLNVVQSENILNLHGLFKKSLDIILDELKNKNLMSEKDFEIFTIRVKKNKNYVRRLHKIYVNNYHKYLIDDIKNNGSKKLRKL